MAVRSTRNGKKRNLIALAGALTAVAALQASVMAAVVDWTGASGTDVNWGTAGNWSGTDTPPANNLTADQARFNLADYTGKQPNLDNTYNINGLIFGDGTTTTGALTFTGGTLFIGSGGITMNANAGPVNMITTGGIGMQAAQTWTLSSTNNLTYGNLNRNGGAGVTLNIVYNSTGVVTTQQSNDANTGLLLTPTYESPVGGPWITVTTATGTFYATNTTNTSGGTVGAYTSGIVLTDANSIGTVSGQYENDEISGGTLTNNILSASATTNTIRYTGAAQTLQLGDATHSNVTLKLNGILNSGTGKLTIGDGTPDHTGALSITRSELVLDAASADIEVAAPVVVASGSPSITVAGADHVLLNTVNNNGTGTVTLNGLGGVFYIGSSGTLNLNPGNGAITVSGVIANNPTLGAGAVVINSNGSGTGSVNLMGNDTFTGGVTVNSGATLVIGAYGASLGGLGNGGTLTLNAGAILNGGNGFTNIYTNPEVWNGSFTISSAGNGALNMGSGAVTLGNNVTITVGLAASSTNTREIVIGGAVSDNGHGYGITVLNDPGTTGGYVELDGSNNTFTGPLTIGVAGPLTTVGGAHVSTFTDQYEVGAETTGSAVITGLTTTNGLVVGQAVTGSGIANGSRILSVDSATQVTLTKNATATSATNTLYLGAGQYNVLAGGGVNGNLGLGGAANASWNSNIILNPSGTLNIGGAGALGAGTLTVNGGLITGGGSINTSVHYILNNNFNLRPYNTTLNFGNGPVTLGQSIVMTLGWSENGHLGIVEFDGAISDQGKGYGLTAQLGTGLFSGGLNLYGPVTIGGPVTIRGLQLNIATGTFGQYFGALNFVNGAYLNMYGVNNGLNRNLVLNIDATSTWTPGRESTVVLAGIDGAGNQNASGYDYAHLYIAGSGNYAYSGQLNAGSGGGTQVTMAGPGTQSLSGANANNGLTVVAAGTLNLDFSGPSVAGSLADNVDPNYTGWLSDILYHNASAPGSSTFVANPGVSLNGGTLELTGKAGTMDLQRVSSFSVNSGQSTIRLVSNGSSNVVLSAGDFLTNHYGYPTGVLIDFDLSQAGTQSATNGVLTTARNVNGIMATTDSFNGGTGATVPLAVAVVNSGGVDAKGNAKVDWAVSGATEIPAGVNVGVDPGTWQPDDSGDGSVYFFGNLTNGTTVSFNTISAGSGITPGQLYYVVGANGTQFKVVATPGGSSPPLGATAASGTDTIDLQGNISALATYATFHGDGSDLATDNSLILDNAAVSANTTVYTLKITTSQAGQALTLGAGANLYTAGGGILFTGANDYEIAGPGSLASNGANYLIAQYGTGNLKISANIGYIYGVGLTKSGPGTLTLTGANTFAGFVYLNQGILNFNSFSYDGTTASALGAGTPTSTDNSGNIVFNGGTLQYAAGYLANTTVAGDTGDITNRAVTILSGGATVDTNGNNITWAHDFGGGGADGFTGGGSLTGGFTKTGAGTLTLQGIGNYGGGTVVNDGTLLVSNTTGSATGSGKVTVNGGTLGGAGKIAGTVVGGTAAHTIAPSATLTGNTATTLTLGGLTTSSHTTLAFNLNTPYNTITHAASVSDQIVVNGAVDLTGGGTLSITNTNTGLPSLGYYKAIGYTSLTAPSSPTANLGITMPTVANGIAYVLDTAHDPGFIDIHRGFLGDANDDGIVNAIDLGILATNYNSTTANWSEGDYNGDGIVNAIDLGILATNYNAVVGTGSFDAAIAANPTLEAAFGGASSVPEPASLALLGIGAAGLLTRRRRRA